MLRLKTVPVQPVARCRVALPDPGRDPADRQALRNQLFQHSSVHAAMMRLRPDGANPILAVVTNLRLVRADLSLLDAALVGDEELAGALGVPVVREWNGFPEALHATRDGVASGQIEPAWATRFFVAAEPAEMVGWGGSRARRRMGS